MNRMPLDQLTEVIKDAFNGVAEIAKSFRTFFIETNDSLHRHTKTHQLHADVTLRGLLREPLPPELPEGVRLGGLQQRVHLPHGRAPHRPGHRPELHRQERQTHTRRGLLLVRLRLHGQARAGDPRYRRDCRGREGRRAPEGRPDGGHCQGRPSPQVPCRDEGPQLAHGMVSPCPCTG